jgi:flagellar motor component MotA
MLLIGGVVVVLVAVAGGYIWEGGHLLLLWQPAEFAIIGGCAAGILLISTPMSQLTAMMGQVKRLFAPPPGKKDFEEVLVMLYQLFRRKVRCCPGTRSFSPGTSPLRFSPTRFASSLSAAFQTTISTT